jgi:hypothetical protein
MKEIKQVYKPCIKTLIKCKKESIKPKIVKYIHIQYPLFAVVLRTNTNTKYILKTQET